MPNARKLKSRPESKPEKNPVFRFLGNPFVQSLGILIPLAVAFSGKIDERVTTLVLIGAGLVGAIGIYVHCSSTMLRKIASFILILVWSVLIWMANDYLTSIRISEIPKMEVTRAFPVEYPERPIAFKVYLTNKGKQAATDMRYGPTLRLTDHILTETEIEDGMKISKATMSVMTPSQNELQVDDSLFFYSTSPLFTKENAEDVIRGNKCMYLMVVAIYRDRFISKSKRVVTEFCAYFSGSPDHYVSCAGGHNRIYVE